MSHGIISRNKIFRLVGSKNLFFSFFGFYKRSERQPGVSPGNWRLKCNVEKFPFSDPAINPPLFGEKNIYENGLIY